MSPLDENDPEDGLSIFDPQRCLCFTGRCSNRMTTPEGLCDRCVMEYAAMRNVYRTSEEWA